MAFHAVCRFIGSGAVFMAMAAVSPEPRPLCAAEWIRAGLNTDQPVWGLRGGLQVGIHPGAVDDRGGPRGLIRVRYPNLPFGAYDLINFIAIEPVVRNRRGFSELEPSRLDGVPGKRIWPSISFAEPQASLRLEPGKLTRPSAGVEQIETILRVERFDNGAHVRLALVLRSDSPDEVRLAIHREPDSVPLDYCILSATMGNKARTRLVWLRDGPVSSLRLYADHRGTGFAPHTVYRLDQLRRTPGGDVLVAVTTDEENPSAVFPFPGTDHWYYGGAKVTQYWRKPQGTFRADLHAAVNARYTYWQSSRPIPGGVAFENFEMREKFFEGQVFIFGITRKTATDLGFAHGR